MGKAAGISHKTRGDKAHPPLTALEGSPDVLLEGIAAARMGDKYPPHKGRPNFLAEGSETVLANGRGMARSGDKLACGDSLAEGSETISAG